MTPGGGGTDSYLCMVHERLRLMRGLLADDGNIFVHCDWHIGHSVKILMDDVFGKNHFLNEIIWYYYNKFQGNVNRFASNHDTIFWYKRGINYKFKTIREARDKKVKQIARVWSKEKKAIVNAKGEDGKVLYIETDQKTIDDVWRLSMLQPADRTENLNYNTQKPEVLLDRIIKACSNEGDLVADFFCGSGTTLAVAEKLGRKWIGCDLGRYAIHTSRKRLIGVQRELKKQGTPYRSFEILNLGKYERQYFVGIDPSLPEEQRRAQSVQREEHYLNLILSAYRAERVFQSPPFHGKQGRSWVFVGPIDAPVTLGQLQAIVAAARAMKAGSVDVLGFEFEMGVAPQFADEARRQGVNLALKCIPKDVFDKRAVEAGQVQFYDLAYIEVRVQVQGRSVKVTLQDFSVSYRQEHVDTQAQKLKPGGSKVTVANGQVIKLAKDKQGIITHSLLTKAWTDWVDYWAVDFDFESAAEVITEIIDGHEVRKTTGNFLFENQWQSFRTRKDRTLELTSAGHEYPGKGKYKIAVKVIDIFGNDTTKVLGVTI